jgi:predicted nucleic acid-binding Zn ribbon protein
VLTTCPACHAESFKKQLTAAGFQLKGSGWYVTDFRGGNGNGATKSTHGEGSTAGSGEAAKPEGKSETPSSSASSSASASGSAADSGGGCGSSCACH